MIKVVINPAHGGDDLGTVIGGVQEKDITLAVSNKLQEITEYDCVLTRVDDSTVDIVDRCRKDNSADFFISIHCNHTSVDNGRHGLRTWYCAVGNGEGRELAQMIHKHLIELTEARDGRCNGAQFAELNCTAMPAVMIEMGYLSNEQERAKLADPAYQLKIAEGIKAGIDEYVAAHPKPETTEESEAPINND